MEYCYTLESFHSINSDMPYIFSPQFYKKIEDIDEKIVPIVAEKKGDKKESRSKRHKPSPESWKTSPIDFTPPIIEKKEGPDKWLHDIKSCLNKLSNKNFENQKTNILELLQKCISEDNSDEHMKKVANSVFTIASTNKFYAEIYAKMYKELISTHESFQNIINNYLNNVVGTSTETLSYVSPDEDYEKYCQYNKANDMRKATTVFVCQLMKQEVIPVLKVLSIMANFQETLLKYIDQKDRTNEVDEITDLLYLFLQECKDIFNNCKADWIWKFVIVKNINIIAKYNKNDKPSLGSRSIFKYMDMRDMLP